VVVWELDFFGIRDSSLGDSGQYFYFEQVEGKEGREGEVIIDLIWTRLGCLGLEVHSLFEMKLEAQGRAVTV
jgi:hypothetical protein